MRTQRSKSEKKRELAKQKPRMAKKRSMAAKLSDLKEKVTKDVSGQVQSWRTQWDL